MGDRRIAYRLWRGDLSKKRRLGTHVRIWENNIKVDLQEVKWGGTD